MWSMHLYHKDGQSEADSQLSPTMKKDKKIMSLKCDKRLCTNYKVIIRKFEKNGELIYHCIQRVLQQEIESQHKQIWEF